MIVPLKKYPLCQILIELVLTSLKIFRTNQCVLLFGVIENDDLKDEKGSYADKKKCCYSNYSKAKRDNLDKKIY